MNETIIENHNKVVKPGDLVYNLGDFTLKIPLPAALTFFKRLKGNQYLIKGNHETVGEKLPWIWVKDLEQLHPKIEGIEPITLCHYAMRTWKNSHHGSWMLYGHSHGMLPEIPESLSFDVGVDCWDFYPVSIEEIKAKMATKKPAWEAYKESLRGSGRAE